jgi:hypothetical protein
LSEIKGAEDNMIHKKRGFLLLGVGLLLLLASVLSYRGISQVKAQSGGGYDLTWNTISGGGATFSTGGGYVLGSSIGQPAADSSSGGSYILHGGFWNGVNSIIHLFLPNIRH